MADQNEKRADIRKLKKRNFSNMNIWIAVGVTLLLSVAWMLVSSFDQQGREVSLSNIVNEISKEDYSKIILKDDVVILEKEKEETAGGEGIIITERRHALLKPDTDFYSVLSDSGIDIKSLESDFYEPAIAVSIVDILWIILLGAGLVLMYIMIKGMQSNGSKLMDFGQSKARMIFGKKTKITFESVAGIEDVKEELVEIVDFLKHPKKYIEAGARIPRGVLLAGAPGTGKTLLAKAVAGEAGVPFFHTSGSEFEEMLVGAGASRVRDLFNKAKKSSPCIIFIDEIDAVAKKRGTVLHSGAGEQTLNQILVEMDGLEERENVIVLAATNRPDVLDPAILRPGRFDRTVTVHMPDFTERREIIEVHAKNKKFSENADLDVIAKKTIGYSGADLENLLNEAAIMAAKDGRKEIKQEDLMESYLKVKLGRQKKNKRTEVDIKRVAYHEAGHAVVAKYVKAADPVEKVSIISRGASGGVTVYTPDDDTSLETRSKLMSRLATGVAGKVAEEVFLGEMSTGASGDIEQVTYLAKVLIKKYGMSDSLGFVEYGNMESTRHMGYSYGGDSDYSDKTAEQIDIEVRRMIDEAQKEAKDILTKNKNKVEKLVALLLEKEEIDREEFDKIFA
jgi:cell division protease FtsH